MIITNIYIPTCKISIWLRESPDYNKCIFISSILAGGTPKMHDINMVTLRNTFGYGNIE